ncbi:hypothetical protein [Rhodohalobacter sp. 8-1]|uniref:hypothetical protein n=1 Tax=Rhodohalobacter sp. 8-1 TaxID=3131972 RepID=UPI0030EB46D8
MSSKIVINIITNTDDDAVVSEQLGVADSVPAPPLSDDFSISGKSGAGKHAVMQADAPVPPADTGQAGEMSAGEPAAGPPEFADEMTKSSAAFADRVSGGEPAPPSDHPDVAGDVTGFGAMGSSGTPGPPEAEPEDEEGEESGESKGKKGSGGKKKK